MPEITVHELDVPAVGVWSFHDSSLAWHHPHLSRAGTFDPFPAYAHDVEQARKTVAGVMDWCPPLYDIEIHLPNREEVGRTNGYSTNCYPHRYIDGERITEPPVGLIVMSGKRIPPHPAMTRYLVGHEYGHHACWMIGKLRGAKHLQDDSWLADYAKLRGLPEDLPRNGSGGNWHKAIEEIFACDFRIMALGIETEYWPHPGIPHPTLSALWTDRSTWWVSTIDELRAADPIT